MQLNNPNDLDGNIQTYYDVMRSAQSAAAVAEASGTGIAKSSKLRQGNKGANTNESNWSQHDVATKTGHDDDDCPVEQPLSEQPNRDPGDEDQRSKQCSVQYNALVRPHLLLAWNLAWREARLSEKPANKFSLSTSIPATRNTLYSRTALLLAKKNAWDILSIQGKAKIIEQIDGSDCVKILEDMTKNDRQGIMSSLSSEKRAEILRVARPMQSKI
jgi:hypothetical protein